MIKHDGGVKKRNYPSLGSIEGEDTGPSFQDARRNNPDLLLFQRLMESVERNTEMVRSSLTIPMLERESAFDATGNVQVLNVRAKTSNIFLVRRVAAFVPAGAAGLLVLDDVQLPLPAGVSSFGWYQDLAPDAVRQLQATATGTMALVLMGEQLSRRMLFH